jgi:hypothetical protein
VLIMNRADGITRIRGERRKTVYFWGEGRLLLFVLCCFKAFVVWVKDTCNYPYGARHIIA